MTQNKLFTGTHKSAGEHGVVRWVVIEEGDQYISIRCPFTNNARMTIHKDDWDYELVDPLPTEPGLYCDRDGDIWLFGTDGGRYIIDFHAPRVLDVGEVEPASCTPFTKVDIGVTDD